MGCNHKILMAVGVTLAVLGILSASINTLILDLILMNNMVISPTTKSYPMWKDLPKPLTANFYLYHISNAEEVQNDGAKPILVEKGPYSYLEYHHKFDEIWNKNGTVTYKTKKTWIHVGGDVEENLTILNVPFATVGAMVAKMPPAERAGMAFLLAFLAKEKLFVTKPVKQILFEGYSDPLLDAASDLEKIGIHMPGITSKFGLFFGRNGTWYGDGIANIFTGTSGIGKLGRIHSFNYSTTNPAFKGKCAEYKGSPDLCPPYMDDETKQYVFNTDLCRTLELTPTGQSEKLFKATGSVYELAPNFFANSTFNPENRCFEDHTTTLRTGVFNASACRFNAPIFLSQPHFLTADTWYINQLGPDSQKPNKTKHSTVFLYEQVSGVPLKVAARFQINIKLDRVTELHAFKNLPETTFLPFMWTENLMEMDEPMTFQLWALSNLKGIIISMGGVFIGIGTGLVIYGYFYFCGYLKRNKKDNMERLEEEAEELRREPSEDNTEVSDADNVGQTE